MASASCNGICQRFKAKFNFKTSRYGNGQKRCQNCAIFIIYAGKYCPCCNCTLRTKPRNRKYKAKLRQLEYEK